jgi:hypothetical protein
MRSTYGDEDEDGIDERKEGTSTMSGTKARTAMQDIRA